MDKPNLMRIISGYAETIDLQARIIDIQKNALDQVLSLLNQHITVDEMNALECVREINKAAALREAADRKKKEMGLAL